jgi:hypothetical protein
MNEGVDIYELKNKLRCYVNRTLTPRQRNIRLEKHGGEVTHPLGAWTTLIKDGTLRLSCLVIASRVGYFHENFNKKYHQIHFFFADSNYGYKS